MKVVNYVLLAVAVLVLFGGVQMGWHVAPGVVDAVNVVDGGGWEALGVAVVDTVKAVVVLAVGAFSFAWARARV
jgi:hypothetical protein